MKDDVISVPPGKDTEHQFNEHNKSVTTLFLATLFLINYPSTTSFSSFLLPINLKSSAITSAIYFLFPSLSS